MIIPKFLYHFTDLSSLYDIIDTDIILARKDDNYCFFTSNKDYWRSIDSIRARTRLACSLVFNYKDLVKDYIIIRGKKSESEWMIKGNIIKVKSLMKSVILYSFNIKSDDYSLVRKKRLEGRTVDIIKDDICLLISQSVKVI